MYYIYKTTKRPIQEILQFPKEQIEWLLFNINKDREEKVKAIEYIVDSLKMYVNPEMYNKEQKLKKDGEHKTILDNTLKKQFKDKGLSNEDLKQIENFFK